MRLRTRAFFYWLIPVAALLGISFWMIQSMVQQTVRDGLRESLRQNHAAFGRVIVRSELRNSRFLKIVGENTALKAALQLDLIEAGNPAARATLEDQLYDLCDRMGFDLLIARAPDGTPITGVVRQHPDEHRLDPLPPSRGPLPERGLHAIGSSVYQVATVPVELGEEHLGSLTVGEAFDFSGFATPTVLLHNGRVIASSVTGVPNPELERALSGCAPTAECNVRLRGSSWVSLPTLGLPTGTGYMLRSLQDVDSAFGPVRNVMRNGFGFVFGIAAVIAVLCGFLSARSTVQPISALAAHLRTSEQTGLLPAFHGRRSGILEIQELTNSFNRAAAAAQDARDNLESAYVEFVATLASALDARDRYTAGHSHRVSELSCRLAESLNLPAEHVERVRMGALLHDIGKIGISDTVLLKPGRLTSEEFAVIRQHPVIGRRILEKVMGFSAWLDAVELHHENWDGTGYPHGQHGEETPLDARIIHVADAYDAMTTDRPYRKGMGHQRAITMIRAASGSHFDPRIVERLVALDLTIEEESVAAEANLQASGY
ncbi:MAG TPA: HD domain-containing phosphohydrolase [Bryobacteraceae bacterium]|nr:HD domain-containing phosphohydrolase [Bryobacteraceae bacterium]